MSGLFITFEGGECSGKSTQSVLLYEALVRANIDSILTREPGGTPSAEQIRSLLLNSEVKLTANSQLLLYIAARIEHVSDIILPALNAGKVVICDRFSDSTVAYQHYGLGIPMSVLNSLHRNFIHNMKPYITFIMDVAYETFKKRIKAKHEPMSHIDRYESLPNNFHKRVLMGFRKIAQQNKKRCVLIDTSRNGLGQVHEQVLKALLSKV